MRRQAILSMPLSFAIVLAASIALSGAGRVPAGPSAGADRPSAEADRPDLAPSGIPASLAVAGTDGDDVPAAGAATDAPPPIAGRPAAVASEPGETVGDVAARVYGSTDLLGPLLDANPDLVGDTWRPLPAGTLLRLP